MRADQGRDHTTAVDIADENHGHVSAGGKPHIGDVAGAQVDFGRRAGAFDDHEIGAGGHLFETLHDRAEEARFESLVFLPLGLARHPALDDDLAAHIRLRLQKHRVHMHGGRHARGKRLEPLRTADLAAVVGNGGIVRHVLGLERFYAEAMIGSEPAEARYQYRFSDIRAGSLQHDLACHAFPVASKPPAAKLCSDAIPP